MKTFKNEVNKIPSEKRCLQTSPGTWNLPLYDCFFGVPKSEFYGWTTLDTLPEYSKGFNFYLGSECKSLISKFVESDYPSHVERLSVGDSSYGMGSGRNYETITKLLSTAEFPKLKELQLGVWELFCNAHCMYGTVGNITELLNRMPALESLSIYGSFQLKHSISLPKLSVLNVNLDDYTTGINGGFITQDTLNNLLESSFPKLEKAYINLECDENDQNYTISTLFLSGVNMPNLKNLEFAGGFLKGEQDKFNKSDLFKKPGLRVHLNELE